MSRVRRSHCFVRVTFNDRTYATWNLPVEQATIRSVMESDGGDPSTLKMVPYEVDDEVSGLKSKDV